MTVPRSVEATSPRDTAVAAIDAHLSVKAAMPGYALRASEPLRRPALAVGFIDECRGALSRLSVRLPSSGLIAVSGPERGAGTSVVAAAVATVLARDRGERTCLVDLDFERPSQGTRFGINSNLGLVSWLSGARPQLGLVGDAGRGLWVLPAGLPAADTARLFHELDIAQLLPALKSRFSWVVVDLPPLLTTPQAAVALRTADGCVVVGAYRSTVLAALRNMSQLIPEDVPSGVVLTANKTRIPRWLDRLL